MSKHESLTPLKMLLFSFHATNTIIISFLPVYLKAKGLSGTEIGWILAVGPFAAILAQPFWGYMSDKYKTIKKILLILVIGLLFTSVLFFQMNSFIAIIMMGALFYFFTTPIGALGDSLAQRRADEMGVSFGTIRTWGSIGFATSALVIGELLDRIGVEYMIWPYLFFGTIALIVILRLKDVKGSQGPLHIKDVTIIFKNKPFLIFLFIMLFISTTHRANDSFIGLYIVELGGTERLIGIAWFIGVASEAVIFACAGWWFRKFHSLIFVTIAGGLYALRWFLFASVDDPLLILGLQIMHGLTFGVFYVASFDYVTRLIPKHLQSTGHLIFYAVLFGLSGIIGSLGGGAIMDMYTGSLLFLVMGFTALAGTIGLITYHMLSYRKS